MFMTIIGEDSLTCYKYTMSIFWNAVDSIKYLIAFFGDVENPSNIYLSIESVGLVIHKAPIVFEECVRVVADIEYLDEIFEELGDVRNLHLWTHIVENVMYNFGDLLNDEEQGREALTEWVYTEAEGRCMRYDEEDAFEITEDGVGDWKAVAASEAACIEKCSADYYCTAIEYDDSAEECRHWQGPIVGDEDEGFICQIKHKDYVKFGATLGKILANIIYISPIDELVWTPAGSNIVSEDRDNRSIKVPSSLFVTESKPMDVFEKFADIATSKVQSTKKRSNQIRSEQ